VLVAPLPEVLVPVRGGEVACGQVSLEQHPRVVVCVGLSQPGSVLSTLTVGPNIKRNSLLLMSMLIGEVTILP